MDYNGEDGREHNQLNNFRGHIDRTSQSYFCTFPDKYETIWQNNVKDTDLCTSCVFFPQGSVW